MLRALVGLIAAAFLTLTPAQAQLAADKIAVEIAAEGAPVAGETWMVAFHFTPSAPEWHGYWSNPGDAGLGMEINWQLPPGWRAGEPLYPLPHRLVVGGIMNHVYEGDYTVLVPISVPKPAVMADLEPIEAQVRYLACTDQICVPQQAALTLDPARAGADPRFAGWRAAVVPPLGSKATFEIAGQRLRIGLPLPATSDLGDTHVFVANADLGQGRHADYGAVQTFIREGDLLVAEIPLKTLPGAGDEGPAPQRISGIVDLGNGRGLAFEAAPGDVPLEGVAPLRAVATPALWQLLLAALFGGLLLNIMPCVFPILSLKALALAKAGGDEAAARRDALAYCAGVVLACVLLGVVILLLRSAGEQVGWAFQLQNPLVVVALFLLSLAITANFLGVFEVPGMAFTGGKPSSAGSFGTGLLAAFVATPCTGPFMALALGAALVVPPLHGLVIFATLGIGLALPFLAIGFLPALRRRLPRPGAWMDAFRRWMAAPMALTALALAWLIWRLGGANFLLVAAIMGGVLVIGLMLAGRWQERGRAGPAFALLGAAVVGGLLLLPNPQQQARAEQSLLSPKPYSEAALARARASGAPVFVWFTADWCVSCKVNERVAIEREGTRAAFERAGVVTLRGDWTRPDPEISAMLTRQGAAGVPLYLWYAPGEEAEQLPQVLTADLLAELAARPAKRSPLAAVP